MSDWTGRLERKPTDITEVQRAECAALLYPFLLECV